MKRKGFTLIELLAVIVILAIISLIATPLILDVIEDTKIKSFVLSENAVIKATENYLAMNYNELPSGIGETKQVSLDILKSENYLKDVKDYKNQTCNGYVLITKIAIDSYEYTPFLKCGEKSNINNYIDDGLVAYWKLDGNAYDYTPNNNHGTLYNIESAPNRFSENNKALKFNGTSSYVSISKDVTNQLEEMSLTVWFNRLEKDSVNADSIIGARRRQEDVQLCEGFELRFYYVTSDYVDFAITTVDETGQKMINTCKYNLDDKSTNHWIFAAITYKKETGEQKLYIKGEEVCSALLKPNNKLVPLEYENYEDIRIGHSRVNQGYFNGYIDDVAIYNRPLTAEEIKLIYTLEKNRTR